MHDRILNEILSELENSAISCEKICISKIDKLCSAGDLTTAARLLRSLREQRIFLGPRAYNILLQAAGEQDDTDILLHTFKDLLVFCNSIKSASCQILAKALVKESDDVFLLKFVREVSELIIPISAITLNRIIFAFGEFRQIDKALIIFEEMKNLKCKPDLVTYNTILVILGRCGQVDDMLHKFAEMKEANIAPDTISYNTIINSLRKVGRLDLCSAFFKEMGERGVQPDLQTYTPLIDNFGRSGNIEEALRLFDEMKHRRIRPSIYVYRSLISNLNKMGKLKLATKFSNEMDACLSGLVGSKDFKRKRDK
nr:pentatricopeptide repeat-containing protein At1g11900 [Coffea arabica]